MTTYSRHRMFHGTSTGRERDREREGERPGEIDRREGEDEQYERKWEIGRVTEKGERIRGRGRRSRRGQRKSTG